VITPEQRAVQRVYDEVADLYADTFRATEPELPIDLAMIEHFAAMLPAPRLVLDAGCGAGRMMPFLAALGCRVEGVDLSPEMIRRAQADHGDFRSQVAPLTGLPHSDAAFDGVFSWYSVIHSPDHDLPRIFAEARRVLRPEGLLLVAFQTGAEPREVGEGFRKLGYDVRIQRYHRSIEQIRTEVERAGFDQVAELDRIAAGRELDGQAVLIARAMP